MLNCCILGVAPPLLHKPRFHIKVGNVSQICSGYNVFLCDYYYPTGLLDTCMGLHQGYVGAASVSLLAVRILTGRRHQIRVHLAHVGCPTVNDALCPGWWFGDGVKAYCTILVWEWTFIDPSWAFTRAPRFWHVWTHDSPCQAVC